MEATELKRKFDRTVYEALRQAGMSNREIATKLGVNESSVRRTLGKSIETFNARRFIVTVTELD
jgi:transposase